MDNVARSKMSYRQGGESNGSPKLFTAHDPIKVVNVSGQYCWIDPRTPVARIAEYGDIPIVGQFIIQENTLSAKAREAYEQMLRDAAPPAVMVPKWPTMLLVRPKGPERAPVTKLVEEDTDGVESAEDARLWAYPPRVIGSLMAVEVSPKLVTLDVNTQDGGEVANSGSCG
ncbi:LOW QUALITY PROTEIN: Aspartic protease [Phytophthora megakarya]|uniref:Aspartic protease n=1 Tax=Phytophthora megakarya TaxID=4795 RepID=A0A225VXF1_9STRA|nr:LOW QUALITY PROTEIN: Aspartic protease [Phytophthora megakarya]